MKKFFFTRLLPFAFLWALLAGCAAQAPSQPAAEQESAEDSNKLIHEYVECLYETALDAASVRSEPAFVRLEAAESCRKLESAIMRSIPEKDQETLAPQLKKEIAETQLAAARMAVKNMRGHNEALDVFIDCSVSKTSGFLAESEGRKVSEAELDAVMEAYVSACYDASGGAYFTDRGNKYTRERRARTISATKNTLKKSM